ncbi:MAG: HTH domain-containing protein [Promethearchaeota archaeon]
MKKSQEFELTEFHELLYDFFEDIIYERGGSPLLGRLFTKLLLSDSEMQQNELAKEFGVTTATISRNLKIMENWHLITKKGRRGSRELVYKTTPHSLFELFCGQLSELYLNLQDRREALLTLNRQWNSLENNIKQSLEWKQVQRMLEKLVSWIPIYEKELNTFLKDLRQRFESLK